MNQRGFYMAGRFVEDAMLDMGSLNPHGRFVHLYMNGVYHGQFHLRERLNEQMLGDYLGGSGALLGDFDGLFLVGVEVLRRHGFLDLGQACSLLFDEWLKRL